MAPEDKLGLIKECRKQLMKSKAKYFALKSDFTTMKNNIDATENSLPENDSYMKSLNEKITAYEKQVMDLQNKLEVLETVVPVQDEAYYLRQALKERENEIKHLKTIIDKSRESRLQPVNAEAVNQNDNSNDPELQHRLEQLKRENVGLNKRIIEQEGELSKNRHLLEHIYKELEPSVVAAGIAEQSPQNKFLTDY